MLMESSLGKVFSPRLPLEPPVPSTWVHLDTANWLSVGKHLWSIFVNRTLLFALLHSLFQHFFFFPHISFKQQYNVTLGASFTAGPQKLRPRHVSYSATKNHSLKMALAYLMERPQFAPRCVHSVSYPGKKTLSVQPVLPTALFQPAKFLLKPFFYLSIWLPVIRSWSS